jgi:hypothetical protein
MLGRDEVDVMNIANILQFNKPLAEFLGSEIESVALVRNILPRLAIERNPVGGEVTYMILAKHTAKIAPGEEYRSAPMKPLNTRLLSTMGCYHIHFGSFRSDKTGPRRFVPIHSAFSRTKVALAEICVCSGSLQRFVDGAQKEIAGNVLV